MRPDVVGAIAAIAALLFACRASGFALMGTIRLTPRVRAFLTAMPLGVLAGAIAPGALAGATPEWAGIAAAALVMRLTGQELASLVGGAGTVALLRAAGW